MINLLKLFFFIVIGGYSSFLSNRGIAIFNHQLRSLYGEYRYNDINRKELYHQAIKLGVPFILGVMLPISIATNLLSFYIIFVISDIIGLYFERNVKGAVLSSLVGAIAAGVISIAFDLFMLYFPTIFAIDFMSRLGGIFGPILMCFALIPAVAIGIEHGPKKSLSACFITLLIYILTLRFLPNLAVGTAFFVGTLIYLLLSIKNKKKVEFNNEQIIQFKDNIDIIKKNKWFLMVMGGILSAGSYYFIVSTDILAQILLSVGSGVQAGFVMLFITLSVIPKVFNSSSESGTFNPMGYGFSIMAGYFATYINGTLGLIVAIILGLCFAYFEATSFKVVANFLDKRQSMKVMGENMRVSSMVVLDFSLLIGSMLVANNIYPGVGFIWVFAFWFINRNSQKKYVQQVAIGPTSIILMGLVINILKMLNLLI